MANKHGNQAQQIVKPAGKTEARPSPAKASTPAAKAQELLHSKMLLVVKDAIEWRNAQKARNACKADEAYDKLAQRCRDIHEIDDPQQIVDIATSACAVYIAEMRTSAKVEEYRNALDSAGKHKPRQFTDAQWQDIKMLLTALSKPSKEELKEAVVTLAPHPRAVARALNINDISECRGKVGEMATSSAQVMMISGCRDDQTSADVSDISVYRFPPPDPMCTAGGACTTSLLQTLAAEGTNLSWVQLLKKMRVFLKRKGYKQVPMLSAMKKRDDFNNEPFSFCSKDGRKKAVIIGCNYPRDKAAKLSGCHDDAHNIKARLIQEGFDDSPSTMRFLTDEDGSTQPTLRNIKDAMRWLVSDLQQGDSLFLHYSGHGVQVKDTSGDEADGLDEAIVPVDFRTHGTLLDDDMFTLLVKPLQETNLDVHLFCLFDCCHSGTILDLPVKVRFDNRASDAHLTTQEPTVESSFNLEKWMSNLFSQNHGGLFEFLTGM